MSNVWKRLAEAFGIETEANWDRVAKQRNMQKYGTMGRRDPQGPQTYFNRQGTGQAQRQATAAATPARMTPRPGGLQIPSGNDRPGQGNPLVAPPGRPSPLGTAANSPQANSAGGSSMTGRPGDENMPDAPDHDIDDSDWLDMLYGKDHDDV